MKTSMLEYTKTILEKVSFDKKLFLKEYKNSILRLGSTEINALRNWLRMRSLPGQLNDTKQF